MSARVEAHAGGAARRGTARTGPSGAAAVRTGPAGPPARPGTPATGMAAAARTRARGAAAARAVPAGAPAWPGAPAIGASGTTGAAGAARARPDHQATSAGTATALPVGAAATEPIEASGQPRDHTRLLVSRGDGALADRRLADLPDVLEPGDVLVVNTSAVLPAALPARLGGLRLRLHLSTRDPGASDGDGWIVEVRRPDGLGSKPHLHARPGQVLALPDGGAARLQSPAAAGPGGEGTRLWRATLALPQPLRAYLDRHGAPIRYTDTGRAWPLETYQTVFARHPGSAESPSAARGFTRTLVTRLVAAGVDVAPVLLHTGVSSQEAGEPPAREWYTVPAATAARVNVARRVLAVGTTAVRALESAAAAAEGPGARPSATRASGRRRLAVRASQGWTDVVVTLARGVHAVDGLLTGWHEPEASHLAMLEAIAGRGRVAAAYAHAAAAGYRWHELGDAHLVLP